MDVFFCRIASLRESADPSSLLIFRLDLTVLALYYNIFAVDVLKCVEGIKAAE